MARLMCSSQKEYSQTFIGFRGVKRNSREKCSELDQFIPKTRLTMASRIIDLIRLLRKWLKKYTRYWQRLIFNQFNRKIFKKKENSKCNKCRKKH